jgi:hypothetical protein
MTSPERVSHATTIFKHPETKGNEPVRIPQLKFVLMTNNQFYSGRSTEIKLQSK